MDFKVAYTSDESKIQSSLKSGVIDSGDMVLISDDTDEYGNLVIINDKSKQIKISTDVRKFANMQLATAWLSDKKSPKIGEIVSIANASGKYELYVINQSEDAYVFNSVGSDAVITWNQID